MTYKINEEIVRKSLVKLNKKIFGNFLDVSEENLILDLDPLDTEWGFINDEEEKLVLGLHTEFPTKKFYEEVLAHEMVHLLQVALEIPVTHGKTFKAIGRHVRKYGLDIHSHLN